MPIRNILAAYNGLPGSGAALKGAVQLQQHFDAHLTGLFAHWGTSVSRQLRPWMSDKGQQPLPDGDQPLEDEIRQKFDAICTSVPRNKLHWIESAGPVQQTIADYARVFDITVLGMHEPAPEAEPDHIEIRHDRVPLESGRPVMVFPTDFEGNVFGGRMIVAWDGGRCAARALADAMLLLRPGDILELVAVGGTPFTQPLPGLDIGLVLDRHVLTVELTELPRGKASVAQTLADHCTATNAGLLVMGAYEHSPLREDMFGGVTHDIANLARIPVLMSH